MLAEQEVLSMVKAWTEREGLEPFKIRDGEDLERMRPEESVIRDIVVTKRCRTEGGKEFKVWASSNLFTSQCLSDLQCRLENLKATLEYHEAEFKKVNA